MVLSPSSTRTYTRLLFLVLVVLISTLLTSRYKLAAPYDRPYGSPINLGHQAWEVSFSKLGSQLATVGSNAAVNGTTTDDDESWQEDTDELDDWCVSFYRRAGAEGADECALQGVFVRILDEMGSARAEFDAIYGAAGQGPFSTSSSLLSLQLTSIFVQTCILSPGLYDLCSPTSSAREDATRGKWQRIDKDVSKKIGVKYLYVYARASRLRSSFFSPADLLLHRSPPSRIVSRCHHRPSTPPPCPYRLRPLLRRYLGRGLLLTPRRRLAFDVSPLLALQAQLSSRCTSGEEDGCERERRSTRAHHPARRAVRRRRGARSAGLHEAREYDNGWRGRYEASREWVSSGEEREGRIESCVPQGEIRSVLPHHVLQLVLTLSFSPPSRLRLFPRPSLPTDLPTPPVLRFSSKGNFTILQVADLHFSVGPGECRDVDARHVGECRKEGADAYSVRSVLLPSKAILIALAIQLKWLETALDATKPDLVVLSGDQCVPTRFASAPPPASVLTSLPSRRLNGQTTSWDAQSVILKWAPLLYERKIPFTTIFGNHDEEETTLDHDGQMSASDFLSPVVHLPD